MPATKILVWEAPDGFYAIHAPEGQSVPEVDDCYYGPARTPEEAREWASGN